MPPSQIRDRLPEGCWKHEGVAVVVGGGPSLRAFDWPKLHDPGAKPYGRRFRTIAINRAFQDAPTADVFFTEDARVVSRFGPTEAFQKFNGVKLLHLLDEGYGPEIIPYLGQLTLIHKKREDKHWSRQWDEGLAVSSNSAVGAINVATILGARTIFLLGLDCRSEGPTIQNYHEGSYPKDWAVGSGTLADYRSDFEHWVALNLEKERVKAYNVVHPSSESTISCWEKITFDEFYGVLREL